MDGAVLKQRLVAILAADVEGYSRLMSIDERLTVVALDAARAVFRTRIEATQGRVIDMAGDSVLAVFETAIGAVSCALAIQTEVNALADTAPADRGMRFRIGVHLGDVIEKPDGTVYGDGVNIAARLQSLAEAGGTSISDAVRGAVRGKLDAGFEDQGARRVKNIAEPVRAFRVRASGAAVLAAAGEPQTARPGGANSGWSLQGRDEDLRALRALCAAGRCLSIVGPAGVGKTTLAQALIGELAASAGHAPAWIDLVPLRDAALLPAAVGDATGVAVSGAQPLRTLAGGLAGSSVWLVLDNAEHLLDGVAALVRALLDGAPGITLIVTSQVPLHLQAEQVYRLDTLALPADDAVPGPEAAMRFGAVACFVEQVRALDRHFSFDDGAVAGVVRICRQLDGMPLALKLAAARVPLLGLQGVERLLAQRLKLLAGGVRDAAPRHVSLRAALDWSTALLSEAERRVFMRLGVLRGRFTMELAAALAGAALGGPGGADDDDADEWAAIETVTTLVDRSLVEFTATPQPGYRLLDSVRDYARQLLVAQGALVQASAHAAALLGGRFAAQGERDPVTLARLLQDAVQPAAALAQWQRAAAQAGAASRLVEVEHHLNQALAILRSAPADVLDADAQRVALLLKLGSVAGLTHGLSAPECEAAYREALPLAEASGTAQARFIALFNLFFTATMRLEHDVAAALMDEATAIAAAAGDQRLLLQAEHAVYTRRYFRGDLQPSLDAAESGYKRYRPADSGFHCANFAGHDPGICSAGHAAMGLWVAGRLDEADIYLERMRALRAQLAHPPSSIIASSMESYLLLMRGDLAAVRALCSEYVTLCRRMEIPAWDGYFSVMLGYAEATDPFTADAQAPQRALAALQRVQTLGIRFRIPVYRWLVAEAMLHHGQGDAGWEQTEICLAECEAQHENLVRSPVLCIRATWLERRGDDAAARRDWQRAIEVARAQGTRSFELRAATGLAALDTRIGEIDAARAGLQAALAPFAASWRSAYLDAARELLARLSPAGGKTRLHTLR
jgi:predicted ATPase/class 3 adenylate cyclase